MWILHSDIFNTKYFSCLNNIKIFPFFLNELQFISLVICLLIPHPLTWKLKGWLNCGMKLKIMVDQKFNGQMCLIHEWPRAIIKEEIHLKSVYYEKITLLISLSEKSAAVTQHSVDADHKWFKIIIIDDFTFQGETVN